MRMSVIAAQWDSNLTYSWLEYVEATSQNSGKSLM